MLLLVERGVGRDLQLIIYQGPKANSVSSLLYKYLVYEARYLFNLRLTSLMLRKNV